MSASPPLPPLCPGCFRAAARPDLCPECRYPEGPRPHPLLLRPSTLLAGRFEVGRMLDFGNTVVGYSGWDHARGARVLIRELFADDLMDREEDGQSVRPYDEEKREHSAALLEGFERTAAEIAPLDHPNLARLTATSRANGTSYLVFEHHDGVLLSDYRQRLGGKIPVELAVDILLQVLDGLAEMHDRGVLHEAVRPEHILLTVGGRPVLLDPVDHKVTKLREVDRERDLLGVFGPWMPIELIFQGKPVGPWSDLYSCAAVLYFLVGGHWPATSLDRLSGTPLVPLHEQAPGVPVALGRAVAQALAVEPAERPRSAHEMQESLVKALRDPRPRRIVDPPI